MKIRLTSRGDWTPHQTIVVDKLPAVVGRGSEADVRLDDIWTSHVHCEISKSKGMLVVRDLESRNGTLVNGETITEARLMPGDTLTIGLTTYEVKYGVQKPESSVA
jgi:pSer/pThr/pTyr-binding forkhead associated (FHA) protein